MVEAHVDPDVNCIPNRTLGLWQENITEHCVIICLSDINECDGENDCGENAVCKNTEGAYKCECKKGFDGEPFEKCES